MVDDKILYPEVSEYLRSFLPDQEGLLGEMQAYAKIHYIPIIHREVAQFLKVFLSYSQPRSILEIGTAIGYSAIFFSECMNREGKVITIEREPEMVVLARENIKKAGLEEKILVLEGEAADQLNQMDGHFDMIFLDGAKAQYKRFLPNLLRMLNTGGTLITDNILYHGHVANDAWVVRKHAAIVRKMRAYIEEISTAPQLDTTILSIGDGLGISRKLY